MSSLIPHAASIRVGALLLVLALLAGCATGGPAAIPTVAVLPSATPIPTATATSTSRRVPPTWTPHPATPQTCTGLIATTAQQAQTLCGDTAAWEACFVAPRITPGLRDPNAAPVFSAPGQRLPTSLLTHLTTAPYDASAGTWGMALLRTAERPDAAPFEATTLVLYGDATVYDAGSAAGPFRSIYVLTGFADPWCEGGPLPGVLVQSGIGLPDTLVINTVEVRFQGTLLVRAPAQTWMDIAVLNGQAEITLPDGGITLQAGSEFFTLLGGANGFEPVGAPEIRPLSAENRQALPLAALPRAVAVNPPPQPTRDLLNNPPTATPTVLLSPTVTRTPTITPYAPFPDRTPPGGVYLTFEGKRIEVGDRINSVVPPGGSDSWVFTPRGQGPNAFDSFEVQAVGNWDPILIIESATFGVFEPEYDSAAGPLEVYRAPLGSSGGDWKITIRDADGGGGAYSIRYRCLGPCATPTPPS
ncbi:MAG: hypothetical protein Kow0077_25850 [Anaerolineae bacterium]